MGVVPAWPARPSRTSSPSRVADDPGHDSHSHASFGEHGSLLDMQLEKHTGSGPPAATSRAATDAPDLLAPEDHDGACTHALDGLHAATTPSVPSNLPPRGTVSTCDPTQTDLTRT